MVAEPGAPAGAQVERGAADARPGGGVELLLAASDGWREMPEYLDLFAPRLHRGAYRALVSPLPIERVLAELAQSNDRWRPQPDGARTQALIPFEAFGQSGRYDRGRLARLYGARRVTVARAPRLENGRVVESWMLASPFPTPALDALDEGTLLLVLRVPPGE